MPLTLVFAVVLLTDPDCPIQENTVLDNNPAILLPALQSTALALEILDPRECRYIFRSGEGVGTIADLMMMRCRYEELHDAPPLCDAARWPSVELCRQMKDANQKYRSWLEKRQELFPAQEWVSEAITETTALYQAWDVVEDAVSEQCYVDGQRRALKRLREQIGDWNYYAGAMSPPVPIWGFARID